MAKGPLKDFDVSARLSEIRVPTLIFGGEHDEVTTPTLEQVHRGIVGSRLEIVPDASHMTYYEQPEAVMTLVDGFLAEVEAALS
jgi:pimeloyl-ACP methyl ester carboxylesterase